MVVIGNSEDRRTHIHSELKNTESYKAGFAFDILLCVGELHEPFAHEPGSITWRLDKLFPNEIIHVDYDPKTRTGFAALDNSSPPVVGMILCLPTL